MVSTDERGSAAAAAAAATRGVQCRRRLRSDGQGRRAGGEGDGECANYLERSGNHCFLFLNTPFFFGMEIDGRMCAAFDTVRV